MYTGVRVHLFGPKLLNDRDILFIHVHLTFFFVVGGGSGGIVILFTRQLYGNELSAIWVISRNIFVLVKLWA